MKKVECGGVGENLFFVGFGLFKRPMGGEGNHRSWEGYGRDTKSLCTAIQNIYTSSCALPCSTPPLASPCRRWSSLTTCVRCAASESCCPRRTARQQSGPTSSPAAICIPPPPPPPSDPARAFLCNHNSEVPAHG